MAGELILIIEDNDKNRKLARDVLQVKGYKTIESETAEEGLELARNQSPALILMDIQLPGIDGYEVTRRIKADPGLRAIPIIAVTSYALSGDAEKAFDAGCDAYVTKPYSPRQLLAKVREYLALGTPTM